jgi:hypothetical protein
LNTSSPTTRIAHGPGDEQEYDFIVRLLYRVALTPNTAADAPTSVPSGRTTADTRRRRGHTGDKAGEPPRRPPPPAPPHDVGHDPGADWMRLPAAPPPSHGRSTRGLNRYRAYRWTRSGAGRRAEHT